MSKSPSYSRRFSGDGVAADISQPGEADRSRRCKSRGQCPSDNFGSGYAGLRYVRAKLSVCRSSAQTGQPAVESSPDRSGTRCGSSNPTLS
mgnify:CR=1 FL=1